MGFLWNYFVALIFVEMSVLVIVDVILGSMWNIKGESALGYYAISLVHGILGLRFVLSVAIRSGIFQFVFNCEFFLLGQTILIILQYDFTLVVIFILQMVMCIMWVEKLLSLGLTWTSCHILRSRGTWVII